MGTGALSASFDYVTGWWSEMWEQSSFEAVAQLIYQWAHWMDGIAIIAQCRLMARESGGEWFVIAFITQMFLARATLSSAWLAVLIDGQLRRAVGTGKIAASCW